jgi:hypothetical protein
MGIPHLITYLRPFATLENLAGQSIVIDGPAFAYHVWHICLLRQSSAWRNPFEAQPSYKDVADTALGWLDELRRYNVTM